MEPNIVVLAGGASSRMKQSAGTDAARAQEIRSKAKAMLSVDGGGRPFLDYLLQNVEQAGYRNVVIVIGQGDDSVRDYYERKNGKARFPGLNFSYVVQSIPPGRATPLGTADALLQALDATPQWKGEKFTVCNSDNLYSVTALRLLREDTHTNVMIDYDRAALKFSEERIARFAIIVKTEEGFLREIIEKPTLDELRNAADASGRIGVSMNIWRFSFGAIYPILQQTPLHPVRQEKELPVAVQLLLRKVPRAVYAIPLSEHVPDMTTAADLPVVQQYLTETSSHTKRGSP